MYASVEPLNKKSLKLQTNLKITFLPTTYHCSIYSGKISLVLPFLISKTFFDLDQNNFSLDFRLSMIDKLPSTAIVRFFFTKDIMLPFAIMKRNCFLILNGNDVVMIK